MFKTLATMEQETGFSFHKELGENFLAGKVAAEGVCQVKCVKKSN